MEKKTAKGRMSGVGLCTTCVSESVCTFPRSAGMRVMDCLEFEGEIKEEAVPRGGAPRLSRKDPAPPLREPGLCAWCDRLPTCTYPKPIGGVWFCEEYL
jgi:hypothetical protein